MILSIPKNKTKLIVLIAVIVLLSSAGILFAFQFTVSDNEIAFVEKELQDGDIIFQTSRSSQSKAIQLATKSKYSHMGMIYIKNGKPFVFEAVQPVKLTPLESWIKRGVDSHFVVKRLMDHELSLTNEIKEKMKKVGERFMGKSYDLYFEWSDEKIYCSELVWKVYEEGAGIEIGKLQKLRDFDLSDKAVKQKLSERYGKNIPMDETVISPVSIFDFKGLYTVVRN